MTNAVAISGKVGYFAKGAVYAVVALLALRAALGEGRPGGAKDALVAVSNQPFGEILLGVAAIGLCGYVLLQVVRTLEDPENKGVWHRLYWAFSGLIYGGLAFAAGKLAFTDIPPDRASETQTLTARAFALPGGQWIVGGIGVYVVALGAWQAIKALRDRHKGKVERVGVAARSIAFVIIGWYLGLAAFRYDPRATKDTKEVLADLGNQPYGTWLLALGAAGLACYAVHCFFQGRRVGRAATLGA